MKSELVIFDVDTQSQSSVLVSDLHIEAPNWAPDGQSLFVNGDGRLYQVPLAAPELIAINTSPLDALNNDHGPSHSGKYMALSDKSELGECHIYIMPLPEGQPRRVTTAGNSYWHSWSPDDRMIAYTARRDAGFQIYVCPAEGGEERCLTKGFQHCDGPDFTPDGHWIWFNGERDGEVDLWRVALTGGTPVRMTHDDKVNWFPHPSPDGQHVVYLAYTSGTQGHPPNEQVELRLMPQTGGSSRRLVSLLGGQGTINVPSWAPSGNRFAFMQYLEDH